MKNAIKHMLLLYMRAKIFNSGQVRTHGLGIYIKLAMINAFWFIASN